MANKNEKVTYSFIGDASSLQKAVNAAIDQLDSYKDAIKSVPKAAENMSSNVSRNLSRVSARMKTMTKTAKSAAAEIKGVFQNQNYKINFSQGDIMGQVNKIKKSLASALSSTSAVTGLKTQFSGISKLCTEVASAFRRVSKAEEDESNSSKKNEKQTSKLTTAKRALKTALKKVVSTIAGLIKKIGSLSLKMGECASKGIGLKSVFQTLTGLSIGNVFATALKEANDYVEILNMFNTITGESAESMGKFVDAVQEMYGLDPKTVMRMSSEFYNLTDAIEAPAAVSDKMAQGLSNISVNVASLFDYDIEQVSENMISGMQGMTKAVRKYGLDLRMATLEQTALAYGLEIDADSTSEANRQALRYLTIIKQTTKSTGDFAKTIESPANQLRVLKEQFTQLARSIGNFFLPVLQSVLPYLNGIIMAIRTILQFVATLAGIQDISFGGATDEADALADSVNGVGSAVEDTKKKTKELLAPFDELNVLNEQKNSSDSGGAGSGELLDPTLAKAIEDIDVGLTEVRMKANDVRDAILEFFGLEIDPNGDLSVVVGGYFDRLQQALAAGDYETFGATIADILNEGIYWGVDNINWETLGPKIETSIGHVTDTINGFLNEYDWNYTGRLIANGINIAVNSIDTFVTGFDWSALGSGVCDTINGVLQTTDWSKISQTISDLIIAAFDLVISFVNEIDWLALGEAIVDLICGIKWKELLKKVFEFIETVLGGLLSFVIGILLKFIEKIVTGIVDDIKDLAKKIVEWFMDTISGKDGFDDANGRSSKTKSTGKNIMKGLIQGINEETSSLRTTLSNVASEVSTKLSDILSNAKSMASKIASTIASAASSAASAAADLASSAISKVTEVVSSSTSQSTKNGKGTASSTSSSSSSSRSSSKNTKSTKMATGGVVTSPTHALIGEGKYPEAVLPLNNSPQMNDLIAQIAEAVKGNNDNNSTTPIQVTMTLDGKVLYKSVQKASRERGVNFKMGAFER